MVELMGNILKQTLPAFNMGIEDTVRPKGTAETPGHRKEGAGGKDRL